jgi:hypothetical protein
LRRMGKGKSPFRADRTHLHHVLMRGGLSQRQALVCILLVAVGSALVGVFLERVWPQHEAVSFGLWLVGFGVYFKFVVRHGHIGENLHPASVSTLLKALQKDLKVDYDGQPPSGHAFRVGAALDLLEQGEPLEKIMLKGGWQTDSTAMKYLRNWCM